MTHRHGHLDRPARRTAALAVALLIGIVGCGRGDPATRAIRAGLEAINGDEPERAVDILTAAAAKAPANALVHYYLGIAHWKSGRLDEAMEFLDISRQHDQRLFEPVYCLGALKAQQGDPLSAIELMLEAIDLDASDPRPHEALASLYSGQRRWPEAREALIAAGKGRPPSSRVLTMLGIVELRTGNVDAAVDAMRKALETERNYPPAVYNLAVIYRDWLDNRDESYAYFELYAKIAPETPFLDKANQALTQLADTVVPAPGPSDEPRAATGSTDGPTAAEIEAAEAAQREAARLAAAREEQARREAARAEAAREEAAREEAARRAEAARRQAAMRAAAAREREVTEIAAIMQRVRAALRAEEIDTVLILLKESIARYPRNPELLWALALFYDDELNHNRGAIRTYREFLDKFADDERADDARKRLRAITHNPS